MKSSVEQQNETRAKLTVEVPFDELKPEFDEAYKALAKQVQVPGFRPGHAPAKLIESRIGRGPVLEQVINEMIPSRYQAALEEHDVQAISQPEIDVTKIEDGDVVEFTAVVDVRPEIKVPDFSEISVEVDALTADEAAVDAELKNLLARFGTLTGVERAVENGDFVSIDLTGELDGEEIEEAATEGLSYEVGSGDLIDGLDEAIIGLKAEESKTFKANLVAGEHEGKEADITVTVQSVKERELPEADDDFAQMASEFDTIDELKADLANKVEATKKNDQATQIRDRVLDKALEMTEFPLPEKVIEDQIDGQIQQLVAQFGGDASILDTLLQAQGMDREEFDKNNRESAEKAVRTQLFLDAVAEEEKPEVSQQEFSDHILFTAQSYGMDPNTFMQQIQQAGQLGALFADVRRGKALAAAIMKTEVKDTEGNAVDAGEYFGSEEAEEATEAE